MSIKERNAKEKIIATTIDLLQNEEIEEITMRRIANDANVTLSSINYYFQSKENLIDIAIERAFTGAVGTWDEVYTNVNGDPLKRFKTLYKSGSEFVRLYPRLAKISVIRDLLRPTIKDNSSQLISAYTLALKDIFQNKKSEQELKLLAYMLISTTQVAILRMAVLKELIGFDMTLEKDREFVSDFIFDTIIQK